MSEAYTLSVVVGRGHWITLVSNKPMKTEHFARLDQHLALQKEIVAEPCDSGSDPKGEDTEGG